MKIPSQGGSECFILFTDTAELPDFFSLKVYFKIKTRYNPTGFYVVFPIIRIYKIAAAWKQLKKIIKLYKSIQIEIDFCR